MDVHFCVLILPWCHGGHSIMVLRLWLLQYHQGAIVPCMGGVCLQYCNMVCHCAMVPHCHMTMMLPCYRGAILQCYPPHYNVPQAVPQQHCNGATLSFATVLCYVVITVTACHAWLLPWCHDPMMPHIHSVMLPWCFSEYHHSMMMPHCYCAMVLC